MVAVSVASARFRPSAQSASMVSSVSCALLTMPCVEVGCVMDRVSPSIKKQCESGGCDRQRFLFADDRGKATHVTNAYFRAIGASYARIDSNYRIAAKL